MGKVLKKIAGITLDVLVYVFLIVCLFLSVFSFFSRKSEDGTVRIFNYESRIVLTNSMESPQRKSVSEYKIKSIPANSMIFIEAIPEDENEKNQWLKALQAGDVLTFSYYYVEPTVITHRIRKISEKETGGFIIELCGDNKGDKNVPLTQVIDTSLSASPNFVIGKVIGQSKLLGTIITALKNPVTLVMSVILPCCMIIMYELYRISRANFEEKLAQKNEQIAVLEGELNKINDFIKEREQWNKEIAETES